MKFFYAVHFFLVLNAHEFFLFFILIIFSEGHGIMFEKCLSLFEVSSATQFFVYLLLILSTLVAVTVQ